jgi:hypothetical protein
MRFEFHPEALAEYQEAARLRGMQAPLRDRKSRFQVVKPPF